MREVWIDGLRVDCEKEEQGVISLRREEYMYLSITSRQKGLSALFWRERGEKKSASPSIQTEPQEGQSEISESIQSGREASQSNRSSSSRDLAERV